MRVGSALGSCYIDPMADKEANERGFDTSVVADDFIRKSNSHTPEEVHAFLARNGELGADFTALALYCIDLRPHERKLNPAIYGESLVQTKLRALRALGRPSCSDTQSCFVLTKKLRDTLSLQPYVLVRNFSTGRFE